MVEVTLNVSQPQDLALLLQLAQRLGIPYTQKEADKLPASNGRATKRKKQLALLKQAAFDPLFQADVEAVQHDFAHADQDEQ